MKLRSTIILDKDNSPVAIEERPARRDTEPAVIIITLGTPADGIALTPLTAPVAIYCDREQLADFVKQAQMLLAQPIPEHDNSTGIRFVL